MEHPESFQKLVRLLIRLSRHHTSAGWLVDWEHYAWDAMQGDGFVYHRYHRAGDPRFDEESLKELRALYTETKLWPVFDMEAIGDPYIPTEEEPWLKLHTQWLAELNGKAT